MLKQIEGSQAIAEAVALCRPEVISCYPITPQTHIVEALSAWVKSGRLAPCEYLTVESEFAALSALIGSSAAGARSYTATSSQGLLFMAEALFNASGMRLPIVMTDGNRAIGGPINIWNDHSDTMALRDCGWIQLHAESNQEAIDLHIQAFLLAERLSLPVMVCVDGFILTHAYERVDLPDQDQVDAFLPPFSPVQWLNPQDPVSMGAMVGPEAFSEVRYLLAHQHQQALEQIPRIARQFETHFGREAGGLLKTDRTEDAETIVVALGSLNGTLADTLDGLRKEGQTIGLVRLGCFRPFPREALRRALQQAKRVVVCEKYFAPGTGPVLADEVRLALSGLPIPVHGVICGLGGRPIASRDLADLLQKAHAGELADTHYLGLNWATLEREMLREGLRMEERILQRRRGATESRIPTLESTPAGEPHPLGV